MEEKPVTIAGRWKVGKRLGGGSFGEIFMGEDKLLDWKVAIKLESASSKTPQLMTEGKLLRQLRDVAGVPKALWYGPEGDYNALVMTLLGPSLEDILNAEGRRLSLRAVVQVAEEMLQRLEDVHTQDIIHRDIKPDNFLLGTESTARTVYLIDFGLAKRYRDMRTKMHIPYKEEKALVGTARYASLNNHMGLEQSRRDDMEALGYIFVYFLKGKLPWQGLARSSHGDKYRGIKEAKMRTPLSVLCKDINPEFCTYLTYCRGLKFDEKPDYSYLKSLLQNVSLSSGFSILGPFDWEVSEAQSESSSKRSQKVRQRRKSVSSQRRKSAVEVPRDTRTHGADDQVSTKGCNYVGPVMSSNTRAKLKRLTDGCLQPPTKSACLLF